jgi:methyl-accepting chemotaxis protein
MTGSIESIGATIKEMHALSVAVTEAVSNQRVATSEISRNIHEAADGTRQVSTGMQSVTTAVQETEQSAAHMVSAGDELSSMAEVLRVEMRRFLDVIRGGTPRAA